MARYIDADKLWNDRPLLPKGKSQDYSAGFSECMWAFSKRIREQIDNAAADVVPKSEDGAECPTCRGTGRIGTTDWLTKGLSKKQLAEEKAKAIAEHELHIKQDYAREIFAKLETKAPWFCENQIAYEHFNEELAELKKKYTEDQGNAD